MFLCVQVIDCQYEFEKACFSTRFASIRANSVISPHVEVYALMQVETEHSFLRRHGDTLISLTSINVDLVRPIRYFSVVDTSKKREEKCIPESAVALLSTIYVRMRAPKRHTAFERQEGAIESCNLSDLPYSRLQCLS